MAAWKAECSVSPCDNLVGPKGARGLCSKHYQRWLNTGDPKGSTRKSPEERFWEKASMSVSDGCWEWLGCKDGDGYGMFRFEGSMRRAHRWGYELLVSKVPEGLVLDHLCRNPSCVNPDHLEPVTNQENLDRGEGRRVKNGSANSCVNGHEYTADNTYTNPKGRKVCRTCSANSRRKYEKRKRQHG